MKAKFRCNSKRARNVICFTWGASFILAIPIIFGQVRVLHIVYYVPLTSLQEVVINVYIKGDTVMQMSADHLVNACLIGSSVLFVSRTPIYGAG